MCFQKGVNWAALSSHIKDGRIVIKRQVEKETAAPGLSLWHMKAGVTYQPGTTKVLRSEWYTPEVTPVFKDSKEWIESLLRPEAE